jgi:beta-glucosidase
MTIDKKQYFPDGFLWGTAISAYQTEGNNKYSDWWNWERSHKNIQNSGRATDHYNRFKDDFDLAKNTLHNNAFRLSIEWSRIEPKRGQIDKKEVEHYRKVLSYLKNLNMVTFVTLHHFTSPNWFTKSGSWLNKDNLKSFSNYTYICADNFAGLVDFWSTVNEPNIFTACSFLYGYWPPQKRSLLSLIKACRNVAKANNSAYKIVHKKIPDAKVAPVINMLSFKSDSLIDQPLLPISKWLYNNSFLHLTKYHFDYLGINYYTQHTVKWKHLFQKPLTYSEVMGMYMGKRRDIARGTYPEGIYQVTKDAWVKYKKPIYITENGYFGKKDINRRRFLINHLSWLNQAIKEGVDIKGYFYWSLMDNFEWHLGKGIRYGLFKTDYKTFKRIPRKSAYLYSKIAKTNSIP